MDEIRNKTHVIILHGWHNDSQGNWFAWLEQKLASKGYQVSNPNLPHTDAPFLSEWIEVLIQLIGENREEVILVGHSLGAVAILRYLEQDLPKPIKAAVLVAPFTNLKIDIEPIKTFLQAPWQWQKIKSNAQKIFLISSDNDPYITVENSQTIAKNLGQQLILKHSHGHFNTQYDPRYKEFPYLLEIFDKIEQRL